MAHMAHIRNIWLNKQYRYTKYMAHMQNIWRTRGIYGSISRLHGQHQLTEYMPEYVE